MFKRIRDELREHAPFTLFGASTGIILMLLIVLTKVDHEKLEPIFEGCHAGHVILSAIVTAGMYRRYKKNVAVAIMIGYVGAIGIGTLSDIVFPYLGGTIAGGEMHFHLAFIEEWWLINPMAILGVAIGIAWPHTKIPHSGHVLLSTWASLFYLVAHAESGWTLPMLPLVFIVLFVAVWLPCCVSDIVFPLVFVGKGAAHDDHHHEH